MGQFYDMSQDSVPRPFRMVPGVGLDREYPVVIDPGLIGTRAAQVKHMLIDGGYFATTMTSMEVRVSGFGLHASAVKGPG